MKQIFIILAVLAFLTSCQQQPATTVHLKGRIDVDPPVSLVYDGAASMLGNSQDMPIHIDENGNFDTIITLAKAGYYSIRRNTLYLTPGDNLEIFINESNAEATFKGKDAAANEYLKYRLFPKGGSFLESGANCRSSFLATKAVVDSLAVLRMAQLDALSGASPEFKELERVRIEADVVNSYMSYLAYSKHYNALRRQSIDEYYKQLRAAMDTIAPVVKPLMEKINDDKYIDLAVVRNVFSYMSSDLYKPCFEGTVPGKRKAELYQTEKHLSTLRGSVTPETIDECTRFAQEMLNEDFKIEFEQKIAQSVRLLPGKPAIDFEMESADGNKFMLSSFKGKVLYIDLWATWCGPCRQETPHFDKLAKTFSGEDIVFLKVSIDKRRTDWTTYLEHDTAGIPQFISNDKRLSEGWIIYYIPRFLLIDKDFTIIDAYANVPSTKRTADILKQALES